MMRRCDLAVSAASPRTVDRAPPSAIAYAEEDLTRAANPTCETAPLWSMVQLIEAERALPAQIAGMLAVASHLSSQIGTSCSSSSCPKLVHLAAASVTS